MTTLNTLNQRKSMNYESIPSGSPARAVRMADEAGASRWELAGWATLALLGAAGLHLAGVAWLVALPLGALASQLALVVGREENRLFRRELARFSQAVAGGCWTKTRRLAAGAVRLGAHLGQRCRRRRLHPALGLAVILAGGAPQAAAQAGILERGAVQASRLLWKPTSRHLAQLAAKSEALSLRLARELGEEGAEGLLARLTPAGRDLILRHGEPAVDFFCRFGPQGEALLASHGRDLLRVFQEAGANTLSFATRHGADGVRLAGRLGVPAVERLAASAGAESLSVVLRLGRPAATILEKHPESLPWFRAALSEGSEPALLATIERGGSRFLDFMARHWKGAGVAALCASFIKDPRAFTEPPVQAATSLATNLVNQVAHPSSLGGGVTVWLVFGLPLLLGVWILLGPVRAWTARLLPRHIPCLGADLASHSLPASPQPQPQRVTSEPPGRLPQTETTIPKENNL